MLRRGTNAEKFDSYTTSLTKPCSPNKENEMAMEPRFSEEDGVLFIWRENEKNFVNCLFNYNELN